MKVEVASFESGELKFDREKEEGTGHQTARVRSQKLAVVPFASRETASLSTHPHYQAVV